MFSPVADGEVAVVDAVEAVVARGQAAVGRDLAAGAARGRAPP
jgi:hypothetical protein